MGGSGRHGGLDVVVVGIDPLHDLTGMLQVLDAEDWGTCHVVTEGLDAGTAGGGDDGHAAGNGCDEGSLGGGHGHEEFSLGILAVDGNGSGEPEGDLDGPDHVLNVLGGALGVETELAHALKIGSGVVLDGLAPVVHISMGASPVLQARPFSHAPPINSLL